MIVPCRLTEPHAVRRIALFGGVYSNAHALAAMLADARGRDVDAIFCLGDLGGFGPHPDRVFPLLREAGVRAIQGNYDRAIALGHDDCGCGFASLANRLSPGKETNTDHPARHERWAYASHQDLAH